MLLLQQSEATAAYRRIPIYLVDATNGYTPETGLSSGFTIEVSENGAAQAGGAGSITEIGEGQYYYEATAAELSTLGFLAISIRHASCRDFFAVCQVVPWDPYLDFVTNISDIEADTNEIQGKLPTNKIMGSSVVTDKDDEIDQIITDIAALNDLASSDVQTVLENNDLDHLIQVAVGAENPTIDSYMDWILNKDGSQTFDPTTDSQEAIRDALGVDCNDWTIGERENIRSALGVTGAKSAASGGQLQTITAKLPSGTISDFDESTNDVNISGTLATLDALLTQIATDHGAGSYITATGFSTHTAANVWGVGTRTITGGALTTPNDYKADVSGLATEANATTNTSNIQTNINANETKIDTVITNIGNLNNLGSSDIQTVLENNDLDHLIQVTAGIEEPTDGSYLDQIMHKDAGQNFDPTTDSLEAIRDRGDSAWDTATGFSTHSAADVWSVGSRVITGGVLTTPADYKATGFSTHSAADIWTAGSRELSTPANYMADVQTVLETNRLDELVQVTASGVDPTIGSIFDLIMNKDGTQTFAQATDSLQGIKDLGDTNWITAVGFSTHNQADVWTTGSRELSTPANYKATGFSTHNAADVWTSGTRSLTDKAGFTISGTTQTFDALDTLLDSAHGAGSWLTGGAGGATIQVIPSIPKNIDLSNTKLVRIALYLIDQNDDLPTTGEITPGTIKIERSADGGTSWSTIVNDEACLEHAGGIYYDEVFDSGSGYASADMIKITFKGQIVTISANNHEITDGTNGMVFTTRMDSGLSGGGPSAGDIADAVWEELRADHQTSTTFGGKNQLAVPSETLADYKATGFSTHAAADIWSAGSRELSTPANYKATGFSTHSAADVWTAVSRELSTPANYKATGFSVPNEYDAVITALQADLDNPNQYKATGFSTHSAADIWTAGSRELSTPANYKATGFSTHVAADIWSVVSRIITGGVLTTPNDYKANVAGLAPANEYDSELTTIQADLDNPTQYKATGFSTHVAADIWSVVTRVITGGVLTTPSDYKADVSGLATESNATTNTTNIQTNIDANETKIDALNNLSGSDVQTVLENNDLDHLIQITAGVEKPSIGSYLDKMMNKNGSQTHDPTTDSQEAQVDAGGVADWSSGEKQQIRDALGVDGTKTAATGGDIQSIEGKIDTIDGVVDNILTDTGTTIPGTITTLQADLDNPTQYQANVSGLAPANEYDTELTTIQADLDNPNQYKADVSALATEANATTNKTSVITEVDANETKIDTVITNIGNLNDLSAAEVNTEVDNALDTAIPGVPTANSINERIKQIDENPNTYKADVSGLAPANEYDTELATIQTDLDNPNQYKADVSLLALETTVQAIKALTDNLPADTELELIKLKGLSGVWLIAEYHHDINNDNDYIEFWQYGNQSDFDSETKANAVNKWRQDITYTANLPVKSKWDKMT